MTMVAEIFQEILSSLSFAVIVVCLVTTIVVLVPYSDEVDKNANSTTDSADKEELYERKHGNYRVIHDLGKRRMLGLSGLEVLSKVDDHEEEELKGDNFNSNNAAGEDDEVFSGAFEKLKGDRVRVGGVEDVGEKLLDECCERPTLSSEMKDEQESPVAETPLTYYWGHECGVSEAKSEEVCEVLDIDRPKKEKGSSEQREEEGVLFDDWEGIERTELEKRFGAAVAFVGSKSNADRLDSNMRLQLYGLHKAATEGPCHEPRPIALKLSARAKWNAWQRLGNIDGDMAMEQYMTLLSKSIPEWEVDDISER